MPKQHEFTRSQVTSRLRVRRTWRRADEHFRGAAFFLAVEVDRPLDLGRRCIAYLAVGIRLQLHRPRVRAVLTLSNAVVRFAPLNKLELKVRLTAIEHPVDES